MHCCKSKAVSLPPVYCDLLPSVRWADAELTGCCHDKTDLQTYGICGRCRTLAGKSGSPLLWALQVVEGGSVVLRRLDGGLDLRTST